MRNHAVIALVAALSLSTFAADKPAPPASKPAPPADLASPPPEAVQHEDGLASQRLAAGTGSDMPTDTDILRLHYTVWKSDGSVVAHVAAPRTAAIAVSKMIPGWRTTVKLMVVGETRRTWVPSELGGGKIPEGTHYVIDAELLEIIPFPTVPDDVAAPPSDATTTESGLAYKVLRPGDGSTRPTSRSRVVVHYTGWTTDGQQFDSSVVRGEPAEFGLRDVIRGWREGLLLMSVGEKTRLWIPGRLAYGNEPGKPHGMLVFDVELIAVK